ncbi:hypothetical protein AVEN_30242-1 [Araneus ventricosus]|uniref:Uncharacterized protein n=1 Tax=Araneus ventricosus TaxID=182803 RepID=A0A4Y2UJH4_ARAVE|nr:hypothetical protein AVEN_30242-1 [Araneus ventricosus]
MHRWSNSSQVTLSKLEEYKATLQSSPTLNPSPEPTALPPIPGQSSRTQLEPFLAASNIDERKQVQPMSTEKLRWLLFVREQDSGASSEVSSRTSLLPSDRLFGVLETESTFKVSASVQSPSKSPSCRPSEHTSQPRQSSYSLEIEE